MKADGSAEQSNVLPVELVLLRIRKAVAHEVDEHE
jgi:hypothetical protein